MTTQDLPAVGSAPNPVWKPTPEQIAGARTTVFGDFVARRHGVRLDGYRALQRWSVEDLRGFWGSVWEFFNVQSPTPYQSVVDGDAMPGARWFAGANVNYAGHVLQAGWPADQTAVIAVSEDAPDRTVTWGELRRQVGAVAASLRRLGVQPGDRVVGYLPNVPETVVAFLATASLGAVWSACAPDNGVRAALDRLGQLEPVVFVAATSYHYNGKTFDRRDAVDEIARSLPTLKATILLNDADASDDGDRLSWQSVSCGQHEPEVRSVPFDHPLWVLFSSGTTGLPKGIVHGHGGALLEHLKSTGLHCDLGPQDRFCWYTNTNWMMWNVQIAGLLVGATIVLYDGSPTFPHVGALWAAAARTSVSFLGTSPPYLLACKKAGLHPDKTEDLSALRMIGSTGSPLPASANEWVRDAVRPDVPVFSSTGGTDIVSGFAGGSITEPVYGGEISVPYLGVALAAWDENGAAAIGRVGELVVTRPLPSMPLGFWNDPEDRKYHSAYFEHYPGVWRHGDWVTVTDRRTLIIHGRSDSTLNRAGVRMGSADIHDVVERLPEVEEALVIGAELPAGGYWMPLFVVLAADATLDYELRSRIALALRSQLTPRHVPDVVLQVKGLPHTRTGKKLEVPVKRLLQGARLEEVAAPGNIDDPALLAQFAGLTPTDRALA